MKNPRLWENIVLEEAIDLSISELKILNKKINQILQKKTELKKYGKTKTSKEIKKE